MLRKLCRRCGVEKEASEFNRLRAATDGLQSVCRPCDRARNAEWRANNSEARRAYHAQARFVEARRRYKKANPGVLSLSDQRRRERVRATPLTAAEKAAIRAIYQLRNELREWTGWAFEVDHIVPLAAGGRHHPDNLQLLKAAENRSKGAKPLSGGVSSAIL